MLLTAVERELVPAQSVASWRKMRLWITLWRGAAWSAC